MSDIDFGTKVRAVRLRLGWRQSDVGDRAGVSRTTVMRIEHGGIGRLQVQTLRTVLEALEMNLDIAARWRGGELDRLIDEGHAVLVGAAARTLEAIGWQVRPEVSFSIYGERGSIDLLAWHEPTRTLLVVEVKTTLNSVEATLRRQDVKVRLAARIARERFGWAARSTASVLALPDDASSRRRVDRHRYVLDVAFPLRGRAARDWLARPSGTAGLLLYLADDHGESRIRRIAPPKRVRASRSSRSRAGGASGGASGAGIRRASP